ncbi:uncharacterized protein LOC125010628 [Mugil cephalus]|uniref:uncharacterized protein LOC125010628 n=1 Tax=Mugil cephalus TaxID=48193 RepID=UPI001FB7E0DA|nr:uncharacterized protein LOC125010628 [Mugil cephalus]
MTTSPGKDRRGGGSLEELTPAEGDQLELRESGRRASIRLVDRDDLYTYKYICSVEHEGGTVEATVEERVEDRVEAKALQEVSHVSQFKVKLLCLQYTVLIVKSLVYCCGLSLLMSLRKKGPSTSPHIPDLTVFCSSFLSITSHHFISFIIFDQSSKIGKPPLHPLNIQGLKWIRPTAQKFLVFRCQKGPELGHKHQSNSDEDWTLTPALTQTYSELMT